MLLAVTGATGYIGSTLVRSALTRGFGVQAYSRRKPENPAAVWIPFDFVQNPEIILSPDAKAVIHLAADTSGGNNAEPEIAAASRLLKQAKKSGAKFIFVSSQAAQAKAPTEYGRTKWRIEQEVLSAGGIVVRLGQVYGGAEQGLFGQLMRMIKTWPALPMFSPAPMVQPVHVEDVAEALLHIAAGNSSEKIICLAAAESVSFTAFLAQIAKNHADKKPIFIPFPAIVAGILNPRLRSLFALKRMEPTHGFTLRPFVTPEQKLAQEAEILFRYVSREKPSDTLMKRYMHLIERQRGNAPLSLPEAVMYWPSLLGFMDDSKQASPEFRWRLHAATLLYEATPDSARRMFASKGFFLASLQIVRALTLEGFWRVARVFS